MNEQQTMMNQVPQQHHHPPQLMTMSQNMMTMSQMNSQPQPQMIPMNRNYGIWAPPPQQFQNPNLPPNPNPGLIKPLAPYHKSLGPRSNWKGKKLNKPNINDKRRKDFPIAGSSGIPVGVGHMNASGGGVGNMNFSNYQPPALNELQRQNRLKTRKFFPKKKYNNNNKNMGTNMNVSGGSSNNNNNNYNYNNYYGNRSAPFAPRNTTSFLIRAKKSGGIASLVSPSPGTPAVLPTPIFSPSREVLVDTAKEEWGVDGYGSMKGLIRLRSSPGHEVETNEDEEEDEAGSSESDVEEHLEVERRLDHDLSRFEMIYNPNNAGGMEYHNVLENRVDDQDTHIAHLEEENLILKERLFLMERELGDMRRRLQFLETRGNTNEEVLDNDSENDSESREEEVHSMEDNNEESSEDNTRGEGSFKGKDCIEGFGEVMTVEKNNTDELVKDGKCTNVENDNSNEVFETEHDIDVTKDTGENNCEDSVDLKLKTVNNGVVELSEPVMVGGDCMEETGVSKDSADPPRGVSN